MRQSSVCGARFYRFTRDPVNRILLRTVILRSRVGETACQTGGSFTNQRDSFGPYADYPPVTEWLLRTADVTGLSTGDRRLHVEGQPF
jgi:hypothetical protein